MDEAAACREFLKTLGSAYDLRAVKTYRVSDAATDGVPVLPCLDHEAGLFGEAALHVSAYVQDRESGDLHEVAYYAAPSLLVVDETSTVGEHRPESAARLREFLAARFPSCRVRVRGLSWWRGDRRASDVARAQISLRDVLVGTDLERAHAAVETLQAVAGLMEKESRVASWGVRTAGTPILAAAGVVFYILLERLVGWLGEGWVAGVRYSALALLGGGMLYLGMKAVHLTQTSNRVWKRATEYGLLLSARRRLAR